MTDVVLANGWQVILFIFALTYVVIFTEKIHRTPAAIGGALIMLLVGMHYGVFDESIEPLLEEKIAGKHLSPEEVTIEKRILIQDYVVKELVDFEVIMLLMGMMIIVGVLMPTGFFEYLAVKAAKMARGDPWRMTILLGGTTTFLSMILDNVTTILLIVPVTIMVANKLKISAVPLLLCEALLSDVGGVGTLVGDPPNIMIASATGFTFMDFIYHLLPVVMVALFVALFTLRVVFWDYMSTKPSEEAVASLMALDENEQLKDIATMKRALAVLGITVIGFLVHGELGLQPSIVALMGGILALIVTKADIYKTLGEVEWPTLLFFAGLFVVVGIVAEVGVLKIVANWIISTSRGDVVYATMLVLWVGAIASAIVDNIPFTAAMIPVITEMSATMNVNPVWWGLAMGVGFGGNGTPIGSSANVITVGLAEKYGHPISFKEWIKAGTPVMIISTIIGSIVTLMFTSYMY